MENKYQMMSSTDIKRYITDIMTESSKLKLAIFKSVMMGGELDLRVATTFMGRVNDFLHYFEDYAKDMAIKMKNTTGRERVRTLDYQFVKSYIYAKYDYASVLTFADALAKGVEDNKYKKTAEIEDFRDSSISKNFDGLPGDTAAVLDGVVNPGMGVDFNHVASPLDAKMFDSIKNSNMFDRRSRIELYKAIDRTIQFLTIDLRKKKTYANMNDMKIFVAMINNIIEYITFSMTAYACRIFIIGAYAYPFIYSWQNANESTTAVTEAAEVPEDPNHSNIQITVMRDADEKLTKDPKDAPNLFKAFDDFVKTIGAESLFDGDMPSFDRGYVSNSLMGSNKFIQKMQSNALYEFLFKDHYKVFSSYNATIKNLEELQAVLKTFAFNNQALPANSSPKQEILHIIRGVGADETSVQKNLENVHDLHICAIATLGALCRVIDTITRWNNEALEKERFNISARNIGSDCLHITSDLYRELAFAFMSRARDLEDKINTGRNAQIDKVTDKVTLSIFKSDKTSKDGLTSTHNMMSAIPDTTRQPLDLIDLYAQPAFESMQLNDAILMMDPMFADDIYFSEAFDLSKLINQLIAAGEAAWRMVERFFQAPEFKRSVAWVTENKKGLLNMRLNGIEIPVVDYKVNLKLPEGFRNFAKNVGELPDDALKHQSVLTDWVKSLYPNDTVYSWWQGNSDKLEEIGALKYRNYFLFQDLNQVDDKDHNQPIKLSDAKVANNLAGWIDTIESSQKVFNDLRGIEQEINNGMKKLKARTASIPSTPTQNTGNNTQTQSQNQSDNGTEGQGDSNQAAAFAVQAITGAKQAQARLLFPLFKMIMEYMRAEYSYIKAAYSAANANKAEANNG